MVKDFQERFGVQVVFFYLGGNGDWVRVGWWCMFQICLCFLIFLVRDNFRGG